MSQSIVPVSAAVSAVEYDHAVFLSKIDVLTPEGMFAVSGALHEIRSLAPLGSKAATQKAVTLMTHIRFRDEFINWVRLIIQYHEEICGQGIRLPRTKHQLRALLGAMTATRSFFIWVGREAEMT